MLYLVVQPIYSKLLLLKQILFEEEMQNNWCAGKIYRTALENATPAFDQKNIETIIRRIYEKGNKNDADDICNTYGRRGKHFLKPLWDEYQIKK